MTATPPTVDQELIDRLGEWWKPAEIVELTAIAAYENFRSRFNRSLGVRGQTTYVPKGQ